VLCLDVFAGDASGGGNIGHYAARFSSCPNLNFRELGISDGRNEISVSAAAVGEMSRRFYRATKATL